MRIRALTSLRLVVVAALALGLLVASVEPAEAHGGRVKPKPPTPGGEAPPGRPSPPPPPPPPSGAPTTPTGRLPGSAPPTTAPGVPGATPTTPGAPSPSSPAGRPSGGGGIRGKGSSGGPSGTAWQAWWELNRWRYFPERGAHLLRTGAVVTPAGDPDAGIDPREIAQRRRALVARQHIVPFLLRTLDPARRIRDEVRAAALIALAKVTDDVEAIDLIMHHAAERTASKLVRESAALAIGLLRRTDPAARFDGDVLDLVRERMLALVDDEDAPDRARAFAALALGLLGDQPHGSAFSKDGRVITRALWLRLARDHRSREIPVALLTAIGMQPAAGTSEEIKNGLRRIAVGRRLLGRRWDVYEQAHALNALVRQRGHGWELTVLRIVTAKRLSAPIRQAAFIALGAGSTELSPAHRVDAAEAVLRGVRYGRDSLTRGMGQIALGRLLAADLADGSAVLLERTASGAYLLGEARKGSRPVRGFATLAIALAARESRATDDSALRFEADVAQVIQQGYERTGDPMLRSAYVVAMGLHGKSTSGAVEALTAALEDRGEDPALRGHASVALAQMGVRTPGVLRALRTALWDRRTVALRSEAALALSFLGGRSETSMLVQELRNARSQWVLAQIAAALGQLGDLEAVPAIMEVAEDERRADEARALAIASLGLLGDPEPKASMLRLTFDANYPSRTDALHEAFTIL
jgi:HEAT repeat protein